MEGDDQFKGFGKVYQDKKKGHKGTIAADSKSDFFKEDMTKSGTIVNAGGFGEPSGATALENILDLEETTQEDIIANVEAMLKTEERKNDMLKKDKKKDKQEFDLNTGVIAPVKAAPAPVQKQAQPSVAPGGMHPTT
jgi:hypothetical protein